ncbi:MAG: regulatory protein RecX [Thermoleophilaceae bacterium]|nr:regulatory protein RecX [Thermoleophilaceae bacterium]
MADPVPDLAEIEKALGYAHRSLARREQTVAEIRGRLERRELSAATVEAVLAELSATGLLDDARFACRFAADKRELDQWGTRRIVEDLERRGVGREEIEAAVAESGHRDELDTALLLLERRMPRAPRDDRERDRAWRLLVRRGYEPELAYEAVREHQRSGAADGA